MCQIWIAICFAIIFVLGQANAADRASKAEAAQSKATVLEQKAANGSSTVLPSSSEIITKPEAQAVDPVGAGPLDDAITCLSRAIYWEARGDGADGMEAVANVVMNRLGFEDFPNTICEVVAQGREQGACQFSWLCDDHSIDAKDDESYAIAKEIARKAINRQLTDRTGGALYFHQRKVSPSWSAEFIKTVEIGEHVFYKPPSREAK